MKIILKSANRKDVIIKADRRTIKFCNSAENVYFAEIEKCEILIIKPSKWFVVENICQIVLDILMFDPYNSKGELLWRKEYSVPLKTAEILVRDVSKNNFHRKLLIDFVAEQALMVE